MDFKEKLVTAAIALAMSVGGAAFTTWKTVGSLEQDISSIKTVELQHLRDENQRMQKVLDAHQEDIKRAYEMGGKLDLVINELKELRADIRKR